MKSISSFGNLESLASDPLLNVAGKDEVKDSAVSDDSFLLFVLLNVSLSFLNKPLLFSSDDLFESDNFLFSSGCFSNALCLLLFSPLVFSKISSSFP